MQAIIAALPQGERNPDIHSSTLHTIATGQDIDIFIADKRYAWINQLVKDSVQTPSNRSIALSDRIDQLVTHPIAGIPIFLVLMWLIFNITVNASAPYLGLG